ncbi:hypothetical protein BDA96_09G086900 [Sorghum bicolor]|uniref:Uncharacterized protein n=1 Tax=Sorghum bicolor TaxID=4558 RepID=A0A921U3I6_SORBI|nr:hypothetical protein BDA96_09G086900 [Sorghum bicolor]
MTFTRAASTPPPRRRLPARLQTCCRHRPLASNASCRHPRSAGREFPLSTSRSVGGPPMTNSPPRICQI